MLSLLAVAAGAARADELSFTFGRFGAVRIYRPTPSPANVALFVSGDGGWNLGVVDMAREIASLDTLVVGVDFPRYMKALEAGEEKCAYPAADFEALSQFVQGKLALPGYRVPVLIGYSSGATFVYAMLVQAPPGTFRGAVSLGFCPDLIVHKPLCKGQGLESKPGGKKGVIFQPAPSLAAPFVALIGAIDQVCDPPSTDAFVKQIPTGELVLLPKVGHGYSVPRNWLPQFRAAFSRVLERSPAPPPPAAPAVADLPLVEVPAAADSGQTMAVILSGDGGWASLDRTIGDALAARGIPVVGLNSLQYFWKTKTPDVLGQDLERILRHYLPGWRKDRVILIGYSFGADVLPFAARRLPADLLAAVDRLVLIGAEGQAHFEFHFTDWLSGRSKDDLPVLPELERLRGKTVLCFYGAEEKNSFCPTAPPDLVRPIELKGGHHLGGDYKPIVDALLAPG